MGIRYGSVGVDPTRIVPPAPATGAGGSLWTDVTLSGSSLKQDPASIISSASYGSTSSITFGVGDPGNIRGPSGPSWTPDCPVWAWDIADPFDYPANSLVVLELQIASTPNDAYLLYLGVYDGTVGFDRGVYGNIACTTGATGCERVGRLPTLGDAAASIVASGGNLNVTFNIDADNDRARDVIVRTNSATGPAYGRQTGAKNPTAWAGTAMKGFLAIGATASKGGGTFADIKLRYVVLPAYT